MKAFFKQPFSVISNKEVREYAMEIKESKGLVNMIPFEVNGDSVIFSVSTSRTITVGIKQSLLCLPTDYLVMWDYAVEDTLDVYNDEEFANYGRDDSSYPKRTVTAEVDKVNVRLLSVRLDSKFKGVATFKSGEHTLTFPITDYKTLTTLNRGKNFRLVLEEDLNPIELPKG